MKKFICALLLITAPAHAAMYKYVDDNGITHFSNVNFLPAAIVMYTGENATTALPPDIIDTDKCRTVSESLIKIRALRNANADYERTKSAVISANEALLLVPGCKSNYKHAVRCYEILLELWRCKVYGGDFQEYFADARVYLSYTPTDYNEAIQALTQKAAWYTDN